MTSLLQQWNGKFDRRQLQEAFANNEAVAAEQR